MCSEKEPEGPRRVCLLLDGMVQGVGFRPFVHRLAAAFGLAGWVRNSSAGVTIEVEGTPAGLAEFCERLVSEAPPNASVRLVNQRAMSTRGETLFRILESEASTEVAPYVLPDLALCKDCRNELADPANRRYRHPFITCTRCGPRYSILHRLPYDRPNTSMASFKMCSACRAEYEDPSDRRFHAQPISCHACGPRLAWWDTHGRSCAEEDAALSAAVSALRAGAIVAVKGLGGFHLLVDACNDEAIRELRARKGRDGKPFAVMVPDIDAAHGLCRVGPEEEALLLSPSAPIVLLPRRAEAPHLSDEIAPGLSCLGLLLPYTPLHHLLLAALGCPVVATSGNRSEEPICTDEREALRDLAGIADFFLVHDRPIARPLDDSIVRVLAGTPTVLRRGRGLAPTPFPVGFDLPPLIALGAQQKNTVAVGQGGLAMVSQHLGDLESEKACAAFECAQKDLKALYAIEPTFVACDMHPDYVATRHARALGLPCIEVQHHHAHIVSCLAENHVAGPVLGVAFDGTGYGPDGTVWGGEFLLADEAVFERVASFRMFPLPGGEQAVREPRRVAMALLHVGGLLGRAEALGLEAVRSFAPAERGVLLRMIDSGAGSPLTSSVGRLFDGVASLLGLCQRSDFEGEAAMRLEATALMVEEAGGFPFACVEGEAGAWHVDWVPMLEAMIEGLEAGVDAARLAARFHRTLAEVMVAVARRASCPLVALSGGCFQNALLTELAVKVLQEAGFEVLRHGSVPPNDGGIALGQLISAAARLEVAKRARRA